MNVFDLFAKLSLDSSEYEEGLNDAEKDAESFGSKFSKGLGAAAKVGGVALAAVGTAAVATGTAMVKGANEVASYGDSIDKMSQKVGLSTEAYQKWDYVLKISGTEMSNMTTGLKTLTNKLDDAKNGSEDAQEMFAKLGLSMDDLSTMSREDVFGAVISGFQGMADSTERAALANDLFGRSGQELAPLFNTSVEETQELISQVEKMGGVMSEDAVKAAAGYKDSLTALSTSFSGLKRNMMSGLLPGLTAVTDGLTKIFSGDYDEGVESISEGIDQIITRISDSIPKLLEVGVKIIESIAKAIIDNLPKILPTMVQLILDISQMIIDNLPLLIETGLEIIMQLANGIIDALPELLPAIVDILINIVNTLIENIPILIDCAIRMVLAIVDALPEIILALIDALPTIITSIVNALITCLPQLIQGAITLVVELVKHLPEIIVALIQAIPAIISALIEAFAPLVGQMGDFFSDLFTKIGDWFHELPNKIAGKIGEAIGAIARFFADLPSKIKEYFTKIITNVTEWAGNFKNKATEAARNFADNLINGIKELPSRIKEIGKNIVDGLKNGIKEKWDAMVEWFTGLGDNLIGGFKKTFGIASPSKVFAKLGGYMAEGLEVGWDDEFDNFKKELDNVSLNMDVSGNAITSKENGDSELADLLRAILNRIPSGVDPNSIFKLVRTQNEEYKNATGASAFA